MNGLISQSGFGPDFLSGNSTGKRMLPQLRTLVLLKQTKKRFFYMIYTNKNFNEKFLMVSYRLRENLVRTSFVREEMEEGPDWPCKYDPGCPWYDPECPGSPD